MFKNLSHLLLKHCRFRIPNKQYEPPNNIKRTLNFALSAYFIYYIFSIVACWVIPLDIISFVIWLSSLIITALELHKRLAIGYNEIEKIEKNLKRKYGKLPQRRPHFFRQFYEVSLYSDFVLLSVVIILYIAENLVNSTPYSILKNLAMTITLIVIWIQCIILNLYERYKAQDIY